MSKRFQGLIIGILVGVIISGSTAIAANKKLDAFYNNIKLVIDGKEFVARDGNGAVIEPFIIDGTTYMPVRAMGVAFNKALYWDGANYTAYIGYMDGKLEYPSLKLENATNIGSGFTNSSNLTDNYGNRYSSAIISSSSSWNREFETLLNMKYSRFKGTVYVPEGTADTIGTSFTIEVDGKTIYASPEIIKTSAPLQFNVDITGGNDFKIKMATGSNWRMIRFGDCGFYQ